MTLIDKQISISSMKEALLNSFEILQKQENVFQIIPDENFLYETKKIMDI